MIASIIDAGFFKPLAQTNERAIDVDVSNVKGNHRVCQYDTSIISLVKQDDPIQFNKQ